MFKNDDNELIVDPKGDFTIYQVGEFKREFGTYDKDIKGVVVDLGGVDTIDTAGVQCILSLSLYAHTLQIPIDIRNNLSEAGQKIFDLYGLTQQFKGVGNEQ